jgi:hypothetical protein
MPVATLLDTLGIQSFIFATNRLRDAVGGSALVEKLFVWTGDVCPPADVLLAVGGNALLRFADEGKARAALTRLSRRAHEEAPGLEFVAVHVSYQPGGLAAAIRQGYRDLQQAKMERLPTVPLLGLGVTASCRETRGPATDFDADGQPIAAGIAARRKSELLDRWDNLLPPGAAAFSKDGGPPKRLRFPLELDHLGRSRDDRSLIGVVHIDGNGIGARIGAWLDQQVTAKRDDEAFLTDYRQMSAGLNDLARQAFGEVVTRVTAAIGFNLTTGYEVTSRGQGSLPAGKTLPRGFALSGDAETVNLPLRPLILGGDDLTFVCDGRLALDLTAAALAVFDKSDVPILGRADACAGVAMTGVHAPILRVYHLAEALCQEAKELVRSSTNQGSALDWHIGFASPTETLKQIRNRQYRAGTRRLTCRPYRLGNADQIGTWRWLAEKVLGPNGLHGPMWRERRNKLAALRDVLREGPDGVNRALEAWRVAADRLALPAGLEESGGYLGDATPLLDALELLDIHLPLDAALS